MYRSVTLWKLAVVCCCASLLMAGCGPMGPYRNPGYGYPGYGSPVYGYPGYGTPTLSAPVMPGYPSAPSSPSPGLSPVTFDPTYPGVGTEPYGPIVMNPGPPSGTVTQPVLRPISQPTDEPVPIPGNVTPANVTPANGDVTAPWAPWPLPPRRQAAVAQGQTTPLHVRTAQRARMPHVPHAAAFAPGSACDHHYRGQGRSFAAAENHQLVGGANPTPVQDLHYRGGKVLADMSFVNLYIGGEAGWNKVDADRIDKAITAAMTDEHLDNVVRQYFNNQPISTRALASHPLVGYTPAIVTRGDVQFFLTYLYNQGYLNSYDLNSTVFNFLLPPGAVLTDDATLSAATSSTAAGPILRTAAEDHDGPRNIAGMPASEEVDSRGGLGGYHGSIRINGQPIYYSAEVFSEVRSDGARNGIPVFQDGWKNVVATLYHEMQEVRTNPDVEDVVRNPYDSNAVHLLGWTSDAGEEIGDFPLHDGVALSSIICEVPLTDGSGTVPVQLNYSNAVHGPEGPISELHPPAN